MNTTKPITPTLPNHHRFHLLDGLRGVAALFVVFWHVAYLLRARPAAAYLGVDFFFCLSGFVVAFSYESRLHRSMRLRDFAAVRLIRLYPMYLLAAACAVPLWLSYASGAAFRQSLQSVGPLFVQAVFLVPNLTRPDAKFLYPLVFPAWSLVWELAGSLVFALLVIKRLASRETLGCVAGASFLCLTVWVYKGNAVDSGALSSTTEFLLGGVRFALSFSMGALALRTYRKYHRRFLHGWLLPTMVTAVLVMLLCAPLFSMRSELFHLLTIAVIFPVTVFLGACLKAPPRSIAACNFLGEASYPLYLLHPLVLRLTYRPAGQHFLDANAAHLRYITLACIPALLVASYAVTRWVDEPLRLRLSRWYSAHFRRPYLSLSESAPVPTLTA